MYIVQVTVLEAYYHGYRLTDILLWLPSNIHITMVTFLEAYFYD